MTRCKIYIKYDDDDDDEADDSNNKDDEGKNNDKVQAGVNISIYPDTGVAELFFGSRAKIFILMFFAQKY